MRPPRTNPPSLLIPNIIWAALCLGVILMRQFLGQSSGGLGGLADLAAVPILMSLGARFLLLPRLDSLVKALPVFIVGMALAEGAAVIGLVLGGESRDALFVFGLATMVLHFPPFALRHVKA